MSEIRNVEPSELEPPPGEPEAPDNPQIRRREAIRRLASAATVPAVLVTMPGNARPARAY
jgi:hypothetical protein